MKKRILSMIMAVLMCMSVFSFTASAAATEMSVDTWDELITALTTSGTVNITLTKNISYKYDMSKKTTGHKTTVVSGTKTLNLNGYKIEVMDESNAVDNGYKWSEGHWGTQCVYGNGNSKTLIEVASGASLTINDKDDNGGIFYRGKIVDLVCSYYEHRHFIGYTERDLFKVNGTLTINGGKFEAGNTEELTVIDGVLLDNYTEKLWGVQVNNKAIEQVFGTVAVIGSTGKVIVNGGELKGHGAYAELKPEVPREGGITSWEKFTDAVVDFFVDEGKNLIGLGEEDSELIDIKKRDAVIDLQGGKLEINGGSFTAYGGANMFNGATDSSVKIKKGYFTTETPQYTRVVDDEYNDGKFYGTVINGKRGEIGITSGMFADINHAAVSYLEEDGYYNTYDSADEIKSIDMKSTSGDVSISHYIVPADLKKVAITSLSPAKYEPDDTAGYYDAIVGREMTFSFETVALTDKQKAEGLTVKKYYSIRGAQPSNGSVNVSKKDITDAGKVNASYTFPIEGWYTVTVGASLYDKNSKKVVEDSYAYHVYAYSLPQKLEVTTMPAKTVYKEGDKIDTTGLVLTVTKENGTTQNITQWAKLVTDEGVKAEQTFYEMTYEYNDVAKFSVKIPIEVKKAEPDPTEAEPPAITVENQFTDVNTTTGNWYYNDVLLAVQLGLVNGKSATEYKPGDNITFAEVIKLAAAMHQVYTDGAVSLQPSSGAGVQWYQSYVDYCKQNGIISKDYNYTQNVTRADYMSIFANALPDEALPIINKIPDNAIPDVSMNASYAKSVYKMYRAGILQGTGPDHACTPNNEISRAEVACILTRMMYQERRISFDMMPLAITKQPESKVVSVGDEVTFTVEVEGGKGPYTYLWQTNQKNGAFYDINKYTFNYSSGLGTNAFTVTISQYPLDAGQGFRCIITDADGNQVTSKAAFVKK